MRGCDESREAIDTAQARRYSTAPVGPRLSPSDFLSEAGEVGNPSALLIGILSTGSPHSACEPPGILTLRRKLTKNGELHLPRMRERMPQ